MTNIPHLHQLLPHDMPMALVDELIDVGETYIHCQVTPSESNLFFDSESRTIPGYVGIEFMAQSVAGWSGYHAWKKGEVSPIGFLLGCRRYQADASAFKENEVLDIYAEQVMENNGMAVFSCRIEHQGKVLASSQLNAFVPTKEKLDQMLNRNPS
ncbi:hotdog family protein [uncultured Photobacterium sp.]|uniref:hotdog family protein n=1 Tax=uncultured Photobacterium sp. TaxID=173973 RepID=UPI00261E82C6|nr:hotdog family protein [uncultured Photobacterium sp.]